MYADIIKTLPESEMSLPVVQISSISEKFMSGESMADEMKYLSTPIFTSDDLLSDKPQQFCEDLYKKLKNLHSELLLLEDKENDDIEQEQQLLDQFPLIILDLIEHLGKTDDNRTHSDYIYYDKCIRLFPEIIEKYIHNEDFLANDSKYAEKLFFNY
ncbi:unnamed protein product, partial [Didymodactylos carnosus]